VPLLRPRTTIGLAILAVGAHNAATSQQHRMIDDIDRNILEILQRDARTPNAEIARQVGMAPSATLERLRKLEERGVVLGYAAHIDPDAVGLPLLAYVFVRSGDEPAAAEETERRLAAIPEVLEVHHVAGEDCFLLKVRATGTADLGRLLRDVIGGIPSVRTTRTTIVLRTVKSGAPLPVHPDRRSTAAPEPARV
jgi:Lrp/AsnC family leucine-responsive transcriptional regulator